MSPKLYIIMRRDIQDMNPGKAMAQAAHAQADFLAWVGSLDPVQHQAVLVDVINWREDRSFGVTLVMHETEDTIRTIVDRTDFSGLTFDPTYPWRNFYGEVFTSHELTSSWVFVCDSSKPEDELLMSTFNLHR